MSEDDLFQEQFDLTPFGQRSNRIINGARKVRQKTVQGASAITRKKECDISGLAYMQFMRTANAYIGLPGKEYIKRYRYTDALCGGGLNVVEGEIIEGSPYAISNSLIRAGDTNGNIRAAVERRQLELYFSDIRQEAAASLSQLVEQDFDAQFRELFKVNHFSSVLRIDQMPASEAVKRDMNWLMDHRGHRLGLCIDPNGPKALPFVEIADLLTRRQTRKNADVTINISATAVKRVLSVPMAQKEISEWIGEFRTMFIDVLAVDEKAWIRLPIEGDPQQWTMITYWATNPRNDWRAAGFVDIKSPEGLEAIKRYSEILNRRAA